MLLRELSWVNVASPLTLPSLGTKQVYVYDLKDSYLEDVLSEYKQNRVNVFGNYVVPKFSFYVYRVLCNLMGKWGVEVVSLHVITCHFSMLFHITKNTLQNIIRFLPSTR